MRKLHQVFGTAAEAMMSDDLLKRRLADVEWRRSVPSNHRSGPRLSALHDYGIETLGDLVKLTRKDLLRMPSVGSNTVKRIVETLADLGLSLSEDKPTSARSRSP
jgi:DNA-directed RNA polymerase alpha subunit